MINQVLLSKMSNLKINQLCHKLFNHTNSLSRIAIQKRRCTSLNPTTSAR
ncbi:hypothetical protein EVA_12656 [gut metagenome]|uniref:Uncharacterized protein n=1 Tax=gut metagenome TaxID=749906 RepID=J9FXF9_9ZZZZ